MTKVADKPQTKEAKVVEQKVDTKKIDQITTRPNGVKVDGHGFTAVSYLKAAITRLERAIPLDDKLEIEIAIAFETLKEAHAKRVRTTNGSDPDKTSYKELKRLEKRGFELSIQQKQFIKTYEEKQKAQEPAQAK